MGGEDGKGGPQDAGADDPAARATSLLVNSVGVWTGVVQRWADPGATPNSREDVVAEVDRLLEELRPLAETGAQLMVDALRPWAAAFQDRRGTAP